MQFSVIKLLSSLLYFFRKISYTSNMSDKQEHEGRSFIREKIVPRKNLKRVIIYVLSALGLGLVFGVVAAMAYFTTADLLEEKPETQPSQIIIVRDDTTETASETSERNEDTSESAQDTSDTGGSPAIEPDVVTEETEPEMTLRDIYEKIRAGMVEIMITRTEGTDLFDNTLKNHIRTFGVIVSEAREYLYVLADGTNILEDDTITIDMNGYVVYPKILKKDEITKMCILRFSKRSFEGDYALLPLGNSFHLNVSDKIYMAGAPLMVNGEVNEGIITNIQADLPAVDGYLSLIYTSMKRIQGGSGFLFNEEGEILGWISDYTMIQGTDTAAAAGISGLMDLLKDLLSGQDTAFLGIKCREVSEYEAYVDEVASGFYIQEVMENSPAFLGGLQVGDRLVSVDGNAISGNHILQIRMRDLKPEQEISVVVERLTSEGYEPLELTVTVGKR